VLTALLVAMAVGLAACVGALVYVWHRLGGIATALRAFFDARASHGERVLLAVGLALLVFGWAALPGPLDEVLGAIVVVRVAKRVGAREAVST
jgi:hypothetical protein